MRAESRGTQTFETTQDIEARRCRAAQFKGMLTRMSLSGVSVTGFVHSIREESEPKKWIINIVLPRERRGAKPSESRTMSPSGLLHKTTPAGIAHRGFLALDQRLSL